MTGPKPRPGILEMPEYMRGLARLNGRDRVIKLSSNENPLGPNPAAREAAAAALAESHLYPEAGAGVLAEAVARRHGLDPDRLVFGAGSDPLLSMLVRTYAGPGDEVVFSATGFARFRLYTMAAGAVPVAAPDHDFSVDVDALLARVGRRTRLVMLASPDNPTGSYVPAAALDACTPACPTTLCWSSTRPMANTPAPTTTHRDGHWPRQRPMSSWRARSRRSTAWRRSAWAGSTHPTTSSARSGSSNLRFRCQDRRSARASRRWPTLRSPTAPVPTTTRGCPGSSPS